MRALWRTPAAYDAPGARSSLIGATLVVGGASIGASLYTIEPRLLALFIAIPAGIAALRVALLYPGFLFAAFLCTPFYKAGLQPYFPIDVTVVLSLLNAMQIAVLLTQRGKVARRQLHHRYVRYGIAMWTLLTLVITAGVLWAPDPVASLSAVITWVVLTFIPAFAAIRVVSDPRYVRQFLWSLLVIGGIVVLAGLWILPQVGEWPNDRLRVFGAHTIRVGQAALLVPLVGIPFAFRRGSPAIKALCLLMLPPSLLVAASSGSRGPLLMLFVVGLLFSVRRLIVWTRGFRYQRSTVQPLRILIPAILIMLALVAPIDGLTRYVPQTSIQRLGTLSTILGSLGGGESLSGEAPDDSTADRVIAYSVAERMFFEQPLLGAGTRSFPYEVARQEIRLAWEEDTAHPHNLVLQTAAELGVVGVVTLALIVATAFWRGLRSAQSPEWSTISILCLFYLLCSMVSTDMLDNRMLWSLLLMLMLAPDPETGSEKPANGLVHRASMATQSHPTHRRTT